MAKIRILKLLALGGQIYDVGYSSNDFTDELKAKLESLDGNGAAGRTPELRSGETGIEWRYGDEDDSAWRLLVSYADLAEKAGTACRCGTACRAFLNLTASYGASTQGITLEEALALVPEEDRMAGQVITFVGKDGTWQTCQFTGTSTDSYADTSAWTAFGTAGSSGGSAEEASITLNMSDLDFAEADAGEKGVDIETVPDDLPWSAGLEE